ncbi:MAG: hypothetical protein LBV69_00315 [Bacteroidales bacterium]|jgi:hypothetical protein|nr:hypothetical protein [Bacteroidales bacterium]
MKQKTLIIFIILFAVISNVQAQTKPAFYNSLTPEGKIDYDKRQAEYKKTQLTNEQYFTESDFIVEGKRIDWPHEAYDLCYDAKGNYATTDIYSLVRFVVSNVYKGDKYLIGDTIIIVQNRGVVWEKLPKKHDEQPWDDYKKIIYHGAYYEMAGDYGLMLDSDIPTIIFCKNNDYPENPNSEENYSNYFKLKLVKDQARSSLKCSAKITGLNGLSFNNREELFEYMQQFEGVSGQNYYDENDKYWKQKYAELEEFKENFPKIEIPNNVKTLEAAMTIPDSLRNILNEYIKKIPAIDINEYKKGLEFEKWKVEINKILDFELKKLNDCYLELNKIQDKILRENFEESKKKINNNSTKTTTNEVWLFTCNKIAYYDSTANRNYFEFDLGAKANNNDTYLSYFQYIYGISTNIVGVQHPVSDGKITLNFYETLDSITYYNTALYDQSYYPGKFTIFMFANPMPGSPIDLLNITSDTTILCHLKVELLDIITDSIILDCSYSYINNSQHEIRYSTSANNYPISLNYYDIVHFETTPSIKFGNSRIRPEIHTDLSTISKHAGTGDILTINGRGFGNTKGEVQFSPVTKDSIVADRLTFLNSLGK